MAIKLKTETVGDKTFAVIDNGHPVYIHDDGKEVPFDAAAALQTISARNAEAKTHREAKEAAEAALKKFEGITDPAAALKALDTVKNLDDKQLVAAGEVEKIKAAAIASVEEKYKPIVAERDKAVSDLNSELIGGAFSRSPLIIGDKAKFAIPADLVQSHFGKHFSVEGGKVVAKDAAGNPIFSRTKPGEHAAFDEALDIIVDSYAHKDSILKGTGGGGGARGGNGNGNGAKSIARGDFDKLSPTDKMAKMRDGFTVTE